MDPEEVIGRAHRALRQGRLDEVNACAASFVRAGLAVPAELPIAEAEMVRAALRIAAGARRPAAEALQQAMRLSADLSAARALYIDLLEQERQRRGRAARGRLVLGLGTGRSGSTSLTSLLSRQPGAYVAHEHPPLLPWRGREDLLDFHIRRFDLLLDMYETVTDVSHWWLPRIDRLAASFPDMRAVVIRRGREDTVRSFLEVKGGAGRGAINHWIDHDGSYWRRNPWDACYPSYETDSPAIAIGRYWDDYYAAAEALAARHPDRFRIFEIDALGDEDGRRALRTHCGLRTPVADELAQANRGTTDDGRAMWGNPIT